ncbi:MAG TPA: hypothetical protein VI565_10390 [Burkholderiales bacterium]|nr:hypothetical protein [Burkholderiales bacterium]
MTIAIEISGETQTLVAWEPWRCPTASCPENVWHVRRQALGAELWQVYERPGWLMAATAPVCPACATTLFKREAEAARGSIHDIQVRARSRLVDRV